MAVAYVARVCRAATACTTRQAVAVIVNLARHRASRSSPRSAERPPRARGTTTPGRAPRGRAAAT
eukprot:5035278-Lingulodinium_polyedra.AAC.1